MMELVEHPQFEAAMRGAAEQLGTDPEMLARGVSVGLPLAANLAIPLAPVPSRYKKGGEESKQDGKDGRARTKLRKNTQSRAARGRVDHRQTANTDTHVCSPLENPGAASPRSHQLVP